MPAPVPGTFVDEPGDSPLRDVPADYAAGGSGRWFVLPEGPDAGRRLFVWERRADGGGGDGDAPGDGPVVLLVHGNPECSYTFRHVVRGLRERRLPPGTRLVAVDHLGFGRSDQARSELADAHHADHLRQLVAALDLRDVVLVVHDWGGPIGVGALLETPERVSGLVLLNTTVFPVPSAGPTYETWPIPVLLPWARTPSLVPDRLWGAHAAAVVRLPVSSPPALVVRWTTRLVRSAVGLDDDAGRVFRRQLAPRANARSSKRLVRSTPHWGSGYEYLDPWRGPQDTRPFARRLRERLGPAWGPGGQAIAVAGVFGAWDALAKPSVLAQWQDALPQLAGHLQVLDGVSHFVEEHAPTAVADAVVDVLQRRSPTRDAARPA